ncbi:MAG: hypothetical protein JRH20_22890 [Deltaproteobacteria bacterium]|nr:hypothetical protein [Deltaproteobacteria bacterium]
MFELHVLWLAPGPAILAFSAAWAVVHPHERFDATLMAAAAAVYCLVTYTLAIRRLRGFGVRTLAAAWCVVRQQDEGIWLLAAMAGSALLGAVVAALVLAGYLS